MVSERIAAALTRHPRLWPAVIFLASGSMLAIAWGFQLIGGLQPCILCLYQRWPYWIVLAIAALAILAARQIGPRGLAGFAILCALVFLAGAAVAGFHVGVEQGWWQGLAACGGAVNDANLSIDELREKLFATPIVRCDEVAWSLFGISMAGWNFLASLVFAAASTGAACMFWRKTA
jgi:disulfide bond formation protein DsbB